MKYVRMAVIVLFAFSLVLFTASEVIKLTNADSTMPVITSDRDILEIPCDYTEEQLLAGLEAYDKKDGNLTDKILAGSFSRFIERGLCDVSYIVFDSANHSTSLTRKVRFTDYHSPHFTLSEPLVFEEKAGKYDLLVKRVGADDLLDGDLTDWIVMTDTDVNYQKSGTYFAEFEVTNHMGDTISMKLPVHILNENAENISIKLTEPLVYIKKGETVKLSSFVEKVVDGKGNELPAGNVTTEGKIDTETAGVYEVRYRASDGFGNTGETWLTAVVEE